MENLLNSEIEVGDWQHVIASQLASIRGLSEPGGIEFYEAAEAGAALKDAGFVLHRRS